MNGRSPWQTKVIEGEPIQVDGRELVPVVKVRSAVRRGVTFGTHRASGRGGGIVWLKPVAVIERRPDGSEHRVPILDLTGEAIRGMLISIAVLPVLYLVIAILASLWRKARASGAEE
jgi:uncharacterized spore protein YtfJ